MRGSSSDTGLSLDTRFLGGNTIDFGAVLLTATDSTSGMSFSHWNESCYAVAPSTSVRCLCVVTSEKV